MADKQRMDKSLKKKLRLPKKNIIKAILAIVLVLLIAAAIVGYKFYHVAYIKNVSLKNKKSAFLYVPTSSDFNTVLQLLRKDSILLDETSFIWMAEKKGYLFKVRAGRYLLKDGMSNNELINMLRSGKQEPIKLTFNNIRTKDQFISLVSRNLEADSNSLDSLLNSNQFLKQYSVDSLNCMALFIPNTYEFYWNTTPDKFISKMYKEYSKFWNADRKSKAEKIGLSPTEVTILSSIVYEETKKKDEMPRIAGVYMNRLNKGMPLEADPTVKFALNDFTITRILKSQTQFNSPYNTYLNSGLPPGPICLPEGYVIDKVLDYEIHDYLFFCAKADFSGYHAFAVTNAQHEQNAREYHQALNQRNIKK
jgi:UPF0755 protein